MLRRSVWGEVTNTPPTEMASIKHTAVHLDAHATRILKEYKGADRNHVYLVQTPSPLLRQFVHEDKIRQWIQTEKPINWIYPVASHDLIPRRMRSDFKPRGGSEWNSRLRARRALFAHESVLIEWWHKETWSHKALHTLGLYGEWMFSNSYVPNEDPID